MQGPRLHNIRRDVPRTSNTFHPRHSEDSFSAFPATKPPNKVIEAITTVCVREINLSLCLESTIMQIITPIISKALIPPTATTIQRLIFAWIAIGFTANESLRLGLGTCWNSAICFTLHKHKIYYVYRARILTYAVVTEMSRYRCIS